MSPKDQRKTADKNRRAETRPEYMSFVGEEGIHETIVVAHVAHVAPHVIDPKVVGDQRRYCVTFAVASGVVAYGNFTRRQVELLLATLYHILLAPPCRGTGMDLDKFSAMVVAQAPESAIEVVQDMPRLVEVGQG